MSVSRRHTNSGEWTDFEEADLIADSPGGFSNLVSDPNTAYEALKRAAKLLIPGRIIEAPEPVFDSGVGTGAAN